jgi:hypothetical protein
MYLTTQEIWYKFFGHLVRSRISGIREFTEFIVRSRILRISEFPECRAGWTELVE